MPFVNFRKKFRLVSFDFRQNFDVRTFQRWLSIRGTKKFLKDNQQIFFPKIITLVLLDGFLNGFSKFRFFIGEICILIRDFWVIFENYSMRMLSIRGNDFIACWAYAEPISSHSEHTRNEFSRMLSMLGNFDSFYMDIWTHAEQTGKPFHRKLSIRGNDFTACWAYGERISSHAEHTGKGFYRTLSIRRNGSIAHWAYGEPREGYNVPWCIDVENKWVFFVFHVL